MPHDDDMDHPGAAWLTAAHRTPQQWECDEDALALRFADLHASRLRYVAAWGRWLQWTGTHWKPDETLAAFDLARPIARAAADLANRSTKADAIRSGKTIAQIERLARSDRRCARTADVWDQDREAFNTPGGIANLATGSMSPNDPEAHMTKIAAVSPTGACLLWRALLERVTGGNTELSDYLQRVAGYCLSGLTSEHALFFLYGTGANGKSVFINTLGQIWGDYAAVAPMETFVESIGSRHPTELAHLRGARLVVASETEQNARWSESKIKTLTGGDKIAARYNAIGLLPLHAAVQADDRR